MKMEKYRKKSAYFLLYSSSRFAHSAASSGGDSACWVARYFVASLIAPIDAMALIFTSSLLFTLQQQKQMTERFVLVIR